MSTTGQPIASQGTTLSINTGTDQTPTWIAVAGFKQFSGLGGGAASVIDATTLSSVVKEKLKGLPDEGQVSLTLNLVPGDAGQLAMQTNRSVSTAVGFKLTLLNGDSFAFKGLVLTFDRSAGVDQIVAVSSKVEVTGAVTFTAGS